MPNAHFMPSRSDGRSDKQIVLALVRGAEPGTLFSFADLTTALQEGTDRTITRTVVSRAVRDARRTFLQEERRALQAVAGQGYRVAHAAQHTELALVRKREAGNKMRDGLLLLTNVRLEELDPNQRMMAEGLGLVLGGMVHAINAISSRQDRLERLVQRALSPEKAAVA